MGVNSITTAFRDILEGFVEQTPDECPRQANKWQDYVKNTPKIRGGVTPTRLISNLMKADKFTGRYLNDHTRSFVFGGKVFYIACPNQVFTPEEERLYALTAELSDYSMTTKFKDIPIYKVGSPTYVFVQDKASWITKAFQGEEDE